MNNIKILAKKTAICSSVSFANYTNQLYKTVQTFPGYIGSNSYWSKPIDIETYNTIITISEWESITSWNNWYKSTERNEINDIYKEFITEEFDVLIKNRDRNDVFLL